MSIPLALKKTGRVLQRPWLGWAFAGWAIVALAAFYGIFRPVDYRLADIASVFETRPTRENVIVVTIDAPSFQDLSSPWPWPRDTHAKLVDALYRAGARAIVFDIIFDQPTEDDGVFAEAIQKSGRVVLAAERAVMPTSHGVLESLTLPADLLTASAAGVGIAGIDLDTDGRLRRMPDAPDSLAYEVLETLGEGSGGPAEGMIRYIRYGGALSGPGSVSYYQALDAESLLPPDIFRDRIVLVGLALEASPDVSKQTADRVNVPFHAARQGAMHGVFAQAEILSTALAGDGLRETGRVSLAGFWAVAVVASLAAVLLSFTSASRAGAVVILGLLGLLGLVGLARLAGGVLPGAAPMSGFVLVGGSALGHAGWIAFRERSRLADGFGRYVSPEIMQKLLADPDMLNLGGASRQVSVVVTDLEGFTTFMESVPADDGAEILRDYLGTLADVVLHHGGMIDQFIGDSLVALFNAPTFQDDHAARALACARDLAATGLAFRDRMTTRGIPFGVTRIGGDTGQATVGNFGTAKRFHYTAMGEVVNMASRLEVANKTVGTHLLVTARLFEAAGAPQGLRLAGRLLVPGAQDAVEAVTLAEGLSSEEAQTCRRLWAQLAREGGSAGEIESLLTGCDPATPYHHALQALAAAARGETLLTTK